MLAVARALGRAIADAMQPRMLAIVLLPALAAIVSWSAAAWIFWDAWTGAIAHFFAHTWFARWSEAWGGWLVASTSTVLVLALLVPAVILTAVIVTELLAMPVIVAYVCARHYPQLERRHFGTAWGSGVNALAAAVVFGVAWIATLPLWLTGIGAVVVPALNSAYLNQRVFRYDALAEHASAAEYEIVKRSAFGRLYGLGLALSVLYYVPLVNLVAPVLSGLAYTHLCLAELGRLRAKEEKGAR